MHVPSSKNKDSLEVLGFKHMTIIPPDLKLHLSSAEVGVQWTPTGDQEPSVFSADVWNLIV